jgi:hypothetical protein
MVIYYIFGDENSGNVKKRAMGLTRMDTLMPGQKRMKEEPFDQTTSTKIPFLNSSNTTLRNFSSLRRQ